MNLKIKQYKIQIDNIVSIQQKKMEKSSGFEDNCRNLVSSDKLIDKILYYAPTGYGACNGVAYPLMDKFNVQEIISILDRNKIESIDKVYRSKEDGFNLLQFVRFFLNVIEHEQIETLYLTIALIDFFKQISQSCGYREKLHFIDITNYICNRILDKRLQDNQIQSKYIPDYRTIIPNFKIKQYLIDPPRIYSSKDQLVYKLSLNKIKIDKMKHEGVVTNCYFSSSLMKVFTLDDLSDSISVYNTSCGLIKKIKPHFSKLKKDIVVLSFAYSQRQERIGAVLKDFSINFWDHSDNFQFEKSISTASHCQQYQTNIWFFQYFNSWVTSDKTGHLYVWNLQTEKPQRVIKLVSETQINDLAVISCINLIAVVQERKIYIEPKKNAGVKNKRQKKETSENTQIIKKQGQNENCVIYLYDFLKGQVVTQIELSPENRNPHTLQYSENYQVLLSAGYEKKISIFQINKTFLDTNKKGELTGHESLITSFMVVKKSPMVVSADDKGKVKIWDIRNYKCVQTLDFRDKTNITKLLDMIELGKIGVLGSRINFVEFDEKTQIQKRIQIKQKIAPLWVQCDYAAEQLIILTKKDLRVIDLKKGTVKNIYCQFHTQQVQMTFFKYFQPLQKFVIGNQKGEIKIYCLRTGRLDGKLLDHAGSITHIQYDQQNKIFVTMGQDSTIQIQKQQLFTGQKTTRWSDLDINQQPVAIQKSDRSEWRSGSPTMRDKTYRDNTSRDKTKNNINSYIDGSTTPNIFPLSSQSQSNILLRQIKNNFNNRQITLGSVSIYHGLIAVGSASDRNIYIWDYEFSKLLVEISLSQPGCSPVQPTSLCFINGYSILVIGTSEGNVYFLKITKGEQYYKVKTIGIFRSADSEAITNITIDLLIKGFSLAKQKFIHCRIYFGHANGNITSIDLSKHISKIKQQSSVVHRDNFNAERQLRQNFTTEIQKKKYVSYAITNKMEDPIFGEIKNKFTSSKGSRLSSQNNLYQECVTAYTFSAHRGTLTGLYVIELDQCYLVSIGLDERIKLWKNNILLCDWNINLPLPFKWDIQVKNQQRKKDKIMFALKIIQQIFEKYGSQISINQSKCLKVRKLLDKVKDQVKEQDNNRNQYITQPNSKSLMNLNKNKVVLFQNQFTKKDMHYDNVKKFNFNEVAGPTLRQIEVQKKLDLIQKQWAVNKQKVEQDKNKLLMVIRNRAHKNQEKQQILQFLQPKDYHIDKNIRDSQDSTSQNAPFVQNLLNQVNMIMAPKVQKKEVQSSETNTPGLINGKINKENYNPFTLTQKPKNVNQAKNMRWAQKSNYRAIIENMKQKGDSMRNKSSGYTFEKYFQEKETKLNHQNKLSFDSQIERPENKTSNSFRNILFRMNSKVKQSKKRKIRDQNDKQQDQKNYLRNLTISTSHGMRNLKFNL